jgi:hypothetical protein
MYLDEYEFSQISVKKLLADGLDKKAADEIVIFFCVGAPT